MIQQHLNYTLQKFVNYINLINIDSLEAEFQVPIMHYCRYLPSVYTCM